MKKILFLVPPNLTLLQPKLYQELSLGGCLVAGGLEAAGYEVDFYELNAAMCAFRGDDLLPEWDQKVLTDLECLREEMENPGRAQLLQKWIDEILKIIDLTKSYDCIAVSFEKKGYHTTACRCVISFAGLLLLRLKKFFPVPVVAGGKDVFKEVGKKYIDQAYDLIPYFPVDTFFLKKGQEALARALHFHNLGEGDLFRQRYNEGDSSFKSSGVLPKYDVVNFHHLQVKPEKIFPPEILSKYSRLKDIEPMMIAPYRMSQGCPYKCLFCDQGRDSFVRIHSVEHVVETMRLAKQKGISNYRWYDDNINLGSQYPEDLADALIKADLDILFSDSANMRHISVKMLKKLRQAGCVKLWFGSETMSQRLLDIINKGATLEDFYRTLEAGKEAQIWNGLNLIIAFPHENDADFAIMKNFLQERTDLWDTWEVNIFRLLSGTTYEIEAEKYGLKLRYSSDSNRVSAFDEVGGLTWEERVVSSERKMNELLTLSPHIKVKLKSNDYYLYSMIRAGYSKPEIHKIFDETYDHYEKNGMLDYLLYQVERPVEDRRNIDIGAHIFGHVISTSPEREVITATYNPY